MKILAIDPGKTHHSFSSWHNKKLVDYGKQPRDNLILWKTLIERHDIVYIEDQFLGKTGKNKQKPVSVKTMFGLVRSASELITLAKLSNTPFALISPKRWQQKVLKASPRMMRYDLKKLSKTVATEVTGEKIVDHDIADAICMGLGVVTDALQSQEEYLLSKTKSKEE